MNLDVYRLIITLLAVVIVILGVTWWRWHAFISLTVASLFLAVLSGLSLDKIAGAYQTGVGNTLGYLVGILALGAILGKLMSDSGAGLQVANFFVRTFGPKKLPWAMLLTGFIIGLPVFFEVGVVILLPLVVSIRKTTKQNILLIALPVLAGLSIVHGIVPPHPGAIAAIGFYHASIGGVLLYALIVAIPSAIIAGPLFAMWVQKRVIPIGEPRVVKAEEMPEKLPTTGLSFFNILLPIILILIAVIAPYLSLPDGLTKFFVFIGSPVIALLISCLAAFYFLGIKQGKDKNYIKKLTDECLLPIGSIILIIGAGGGFKQILIDSGVGDSIAHMSQSMSLSPIVLAFVVAGLIRVATGSATVSLTTAAGIVAPIVAHMSGVNLELLVIATGAGSLMLSHVNDAGFWLVREYLGLTVKETFKTWTVLETLLSFVAFGMVLILNAIV